MSQSSHEKQGKFYNKRMAIFFALERMNLSLLDESFQKLGKRLQKALSMPDENGRTPLLESLQLGFYEGFEKITEQLEANSPVFFTPDAYDNSYVSYLAREGKWDLLKSAFRPEHRPLLLKQNQYGETPLLMACIWAPFQKTGLLKTIEFLLEQGSFVHHSTFSNCTALSALLAHKRNVSGYPEIQKAIVALSLHGALLCQRLPGAEQFPDLHAEPELLTYAAFFDKKPASSVFPDSMWGLDTFEGYLKRLKTKIDLARGPEKSAFENQLKNVRYALDIFSLPASSKAFGQTFFKPSFRPVIPRLDEAHDMTISQLTPNNPQSEKARKLHTLSLFWLLQCYKEYYEPERLAIFIKENTIWTLLVFGVAWSGIFIAMMIDNAVRRFSIPGYRDRGELAPAVQDAVKEANDKTIPYFIAQGALFAAALLVWIPYLVVTESEKKRQRGLVQAYPNRSDIEVLIKELQSFIHDYAKFERDFNRIDNIEKLEAFTHDTGNILYRASQHLDVRLQ